MSLGTGVEFEWSLVYHSLLRGGIAAPDLKRRVSASAGKLQAWGKDVAAWAQSGVSAAERVIGKKGLLSAYHSDELHIAGNPEPKTDIVYKISPGYYCSVKMRGPIQLASGQGASSALMFDRVAAAVSARDPKIKAIVQSLKTLPTKLISESNVARLKQEQPTMINAFLQHGKLLDSASYEYWASHNLDALMANIEHYVEADPTFHEALIKEALTGALVFRSNPPAIANYVITPDHFDKIDASYVRKTMTKTKIGIRAKSRGGVTSVSVRFDSKV